MTHRLVFALILLLSPLAASQATGTDIMKVTFRTTDCSGATGLASVNVDHIARTQPYDCPGGRKLKQVLTRSPGVNEAYTIAEDEAPKLEAQIQRVMDARQKALESNKPIIIQQR